MRILLCGLTSIEYFLDREGCKMTGGVRQRLKRWKSDWRNDVVEIIAADVDIHFILNIFYYSPLRHCDWTSIQSLQ